MLNRRVLLFALMLGSGMELRANPILNATYEGTNEDVSGEKCSVTFVKVGYPAGGITKYMLEAEVRARRIKTLRVPIAPFESALQNFVPNGEVWGTYREDLVGYETRTINIVLDGNALPKNFEYHRLKWSFLFKKTEDLRCSNLKRVSQ